VLRFRELEATALYAGLGVQLIDEYASVPNTRDAPAIGPVTIELDIDEAGTWRPIDTAGHLQRRTPSGIVWFPWLEYHRDARGMAPRKYRVRVSAPAYIPLYQWDSSGLEALVYPYDNVEPPAGPASLLRAVLLPSAMYPFAPDVPILRGVVTDAGTPVPEVLVYWTDATLRTDRVLTDADGEFELPMRRAPPGPNPIFVAAETPFGGPSGDVPVRLPQDLPAFQTIQIS
jgi:hypothetical protein